MENLKVEIVSNNSQVAEAASKELVKIGGKEVTTFLISLLESEIPGVRDIAALGLRDIGCSQAVEPLFKAICKKQNEKHRGTLVYALQTLDCSQKLIDLFDLLFYGNGEVRMGVSVILDEQIFDFTKEDVQEIVYRWQDVQKQRNVISNLDEETRLLVNHYVEGFAAYLKDSPR